MKSVLESSLPELEIAVPPVPEEALRKLPSYCPKPTKNNLLTQYYFWIKSLLKENRRLLQEKQTLEEKYKEAKNELERSEKEKEEIKSERDKFKAMLFKPKRKNTSKVCKASVPRTKESYLRPIPEKIHERREAILKRCPHCDSKLSKRIGSYQRIVEDIPSFEQQKAKATQYTINRYYCKHCRKIVQAKLKEVLPRSRLGPNALLYVLYSKYRLRLTNGLIAENLKTCYQLKVSEGEIVNLLDKGRYIFKEKWREIIERIKIAKVVNGDETSWRIDGQNCWLWAFAGDKAVRYTIAESRGKGVPQEVLGKDFQGVVVSDFYSAYSQFKQKQRCWVHLLRKVRELCLQRKTSQRNRINSLLNCVYQEIASFRSEENTTRKERDEKAESIRLKLINLGKIKTKDFNLKIFLNRCAKFSEELVVCIRDFSVPPENNEAERVIRKAVVMRKISGGSRSIKGAQTYEVNLSVIETLKKEKENLFFAMKNLLNGYLASIG